VTSALLATLAGLGAGFSLIIAIGAQNAFVLRQGIRREHVALVVAICVISDGLLIGLGVIGFGFLASQAPVVITIVRWVGAAFLVTYGVLAARRALKPASLVAAEDRKTGSWISIALTCLAFTWLNPHVYLDTVLLLGSLANTHGTSGRWFFALGAAIASLIWFCALGFGARLLTAFFARPLSWRVLDGSVAALMFVLAGTLVL
jgi:L-lysine exporter family protein LysE/ArgO